MVARSSYGPRPDTVISAISGACSHFSQVRTSLPVSRQHPGGKRQATGRLSQREIALCDFAECDAACVTQEHCEHAHHGWRDAGLELEHELLGYACRDQISGSESFNELFTETPKGRDLEGDLLLLLGASAGGDGVRQVQQAEATSVATLSCRSVPSSCCSGAISVATLNCQSVSFSFDSLRFAGNSGMEIARMGSSHNCSEDSAFPHHTCHSDSG